MAQQQRLQDISKSVAGKTEQGLSLKLPAAFPQPDAVNARQPICSFPLPSPPDFSQVVKICGGSSVPVLQDIGLVLPSPFKLNLNCFKTLSRVDDGRYLIRHVKL
ncbi:hypothetical protein F2P81_022980 [Scophthalmus maximus]|uniref:Uncharacterized protein n=1 Tax=Scophthalmus maximus TaxID=52904 RepID=A0A6A4RW81_SCOMX|nr:hypothetical protein F2P81_022980 [Scophthalmus maximus]